MIDKKEVVSINILNDTQLHAELLDKTVLLDTTMEFDGQRFKTSEEIQNYLLNK